MKFQNLTIKNFGSIGDMTLPLDGQGLVLLLGRNEDAPLADSNGAGKSLPLDAFTWALWGNTVRGVKGDEVVHTKARANCSVALEFEEDNAKYRVIRYRKNKDGSSSKPNDLVLEHNDEEVSGASMAATQDMINDILGLDFVTFCAMMPGAGINVASMTDVEVKSLLEKLLRTEVLAKASDEAKKRAKNIRADFTVATTRLKDITIFVEEAKGRLAELEAKHSSHEEVLSKHLETITERIEANKKAKEEILKILSRKDDHLADQTKYLNRLAEIDATISQNDAMIAKITAHYREQSGILDRKIAVAGSERQWLDNQKADLEGLEGSCPTCEQTVNDTQRALLLGNKNAAIKAKKKLIKELQATNNKLLATWASETETLKELNEGHEEDKQLANKLFNFATQKVQEMKEYEIRLENVDTNLKELQDGKAESKSTENPFTDLIEQTKSEIQSKEFEQEALNQEVLELDNQLQMITFWVESFSPKGLRSFMLENITPILNNYAKKYADIITEGEMEIVFSTKDTLKDGSNKEKFNIKVSQKHGGNTYASNSSGEKARANLIIALALGELAVQRTEKTIPFRFLDEPFESIDETGSEAIVNLLNQMKDKYNTVYVITHQDYLKQLFPKKLTIVKQNGYSALEN